MSLAESPLKYTGSSGVASEKGDFLWECTGLSGFTPKGEFVWERTGLPGLTSKRRFVLRVYGDCPLDPRKWFCMEACRAVWLCFWMWKLCRSPPVCPAWLPKGVYAEVYQLVWLAFGIEIWMEMEAYQSVWLSFHMRMNQNESKLTSSV